MTVVKFKDGARLRGPRAELIFALQIIQSVFSKHSIPELVITSGSDGVHSEGSSHYRGEAVDFRSKEVPREILDVVLKDLKSCTGDDYQVLLENAGMVNEHFHCQYRPMRP